MDYIVPLLAQVVPLGAYFAFLAGLARIITPPDQAAAKPPVDDMARILLVDDDLSIRRLLQTILTTDGHEVTTACDGNEGLRFVQESTFDLVITDLIMPDKEGLEMIREIRHSLPQQKIIAMTGGGYGNPADYLAWAKAFGVQETILKPFTRDEMIFAVRNTLGAV